MHLRAKTPQINNLLPRLPDYQDDPDQVKVSSINKYLSTFKQPNDLSKEDIMVLISKAQQEIDQRLYDQLLSSNYNNHINILQKPSKRRQSENNTSTNKQRNFRMKTQLPAFKHALP